VVDFAATWADNLDDAIEDVAYMAALDEVQARSPGVAAQPGQTEALDAGVADLLGQRGLPPGRCSRGRWRRLIALPPI
jgi:hypothetical protein